MSELQRYRATVGNKASDRREWVYLCVDVDEVISDAMQQAREAKLFKVSLAEAVDKIVTLEAEAQALREERDSQQRVAINAMEELESLRARVLVLPDASTVYAALDARERLFTSPENIQVALEAQSRLNGKTVSEALLRQLLDSDGIDGIFDAQQNYAAHQELRALLNQDKENGNG